MDEDHASFMGYLMGGDSVRRRQTGGALRDHRSVASLVDEFLGHELGRRRNIGGVLRGEARWPHVNLNAPEVTGCTVFAACSVQ
jgi:hypothetical protein